MSKQPDNKSDRILSKRDLFFAWFRYNMFGHVAQSTDRLQGGGFCVAISRTLENLYTDKERLAQALKRHMVLFNCNVNWASIIMGSTVALEEAKAQNDDAVPEEMITGLKTGLMGPVAGIGDTIDWLTISPILVSMFLPAAKEGNFLAAMAEPIIFALICTTIGYMLFQLGYYQGRNSIATLLKGSRIKKIIEGCSIMGMFMMGSICANFVRASTPLPLTIGNDVYKIQDYFDMIAPGILPLTAVVLSYLYLERKGNKYMHVLIGLLVIGVVLGSLGIL